MSVEKNRTLLNLAALHCAVCGAWPCATTEASEGNNLARHKPATASSIEFRRVIPEAATDGKQLTRWSSKFEDPQWLAIDLEKVHVIDKVRLLVEAPAKSFQIQTSLDNRQWTDVFSVNGAVAQARHAREIRFPPVTARYVRFLGTERATRFGYSLYEVEVYAAGTDFDPLEYASLALNKPATASGSLWKAATPQYAVNGLVYDWWASLVADEQWFQLDLEQLTDIGRILLYWGNYPTVFKVQVSANGTSWKDVAENVALTKVTHEEIIGTHDLAFSPATKARYVRLLLTQRFDSKHAYGLHEIQVFPPPTVRPRARRSSRPTLRQNSSRSLTPNPTTLLP